MRLLGFLVLAVYLLSPGRGLAQTETTLTYQGSLSSGGSPATGSYNINFTLWDAVTRGTQIGPGVTLSAHSVSDGILTAELDFGASAFNNSLRWLEIKVDGTTLSPRQPITRTPYAIQTRGINVSDAGKVGIGTTIPQSLLQVIGSAGSDHAISGYNITGTGNAAGVYGHTSSVSGYGLSGYAAPTSGFNYGVWGESNSITGTGVYGRASQGVGGNFGVVGHSNSSSGTGVYGFASSNSGNTRAIHGESTSPTGFAGFFTGRGYFSKSVGFGTMNPSYPVHALNNSTNGIAIYGEGTWGVQGTSTQNGGRGVFGFDANNAGDSYGIYGLTASASGTGVYGFAAVSSGNTRGVLGESASTTGRGVYGLATARSGNAYGVYGRSDSATGRGVYGFVSDISGVNHGVHGESDSAFGRGVVGRATAFTGSTQGVRGEAVSPDGIGVVGRNDSGTGSAYGVFAQTSSNSGVAMLGATLSTSGSTIGVYGSCLSPNGYAFFANSAGDDYGSFSSRRWKNNIVNIDDPLGKLAQIRGVYYDWDAEHGGEHDVGMIAEEVGAVMPEIVQYEENGIDAIGMDYSRTTPLLVEAVNALRAEKDAEIDELAHQNEHLRARIDALEMMVTQLVDTQPKGLKR